MIGTQTFIKKPKVSELTVIFPGKLDFFTMLGSTSSVIGHQSQAGDASGNTFQDTLSRYRRRQGLPSITIGLPAMADVGMINDSTTAASFSTSDIVWMKETELHRIMVLCMRGKTQGVKIPAQVCTGLPSGSRLQSTQASAPLYFERPFFAALKVLEVSRLGEDAIVMLAQSRKAIIERFETAKTLDTVQTRVRELLAARLADDLGATPENIDLSETLATYGVDSLKVLDLRS